MSMTASARGEEFRDDVRKRLPREFLAPLTRIDPLRSTVAVMQTFAMLAVVVGFAVTFWSWWTALIAIVLMGPLAHALFILSHDAAHYRLYETRWLNDLVGRGGPRNSDRRISEASAPIGGASRDTRSEEHETTPQDPLSGLQGQGGLGRR